MTTYSAAAPAAGAAASGRDVHQRARASKQASATREASAQAEDSGDNDGASDFSMRRMGEGFDPRG